MDLTDEDLLRRAVTMATNHEHGAFPRWSVVRDIFGFGSGSAHELCRRFDVDPDEIMKGKPQICTGCGEDEIGDDGLCPTCDEGRRIEDARRNYRFRHEPQETGRCFDCVSCSHHLLGGECQFLDIAIADTRKSRCPLHEPLPPNSQAQRLAKGQSGEADCSASADGEK